MRRRMLLLGCALWLLVPGLAEAGRRAFVDPSTGVLKAHGFVETNAPGDVSVEVPDDFQLTPGRWRWTGVAWVPFIPPPPPPTRAALLRAAARAHVSATLADPAVPQRVKDSLRALMDVLDE